MNTTTNTNANDRITTTVSADATTYQVNGETIAYIIPLFSDRTSSATFTAETGQTNRNVTHEVINTATGAIFYANGYFDAEALALGIAHSHLFPALAKEQEGDFKSAQHLLAERDTARAKVSQIRSFIQASIDRGEWEDELEEIFWEELAEILDLDLKLTEEKEITFTVTFNATVTVPKNADLDDLDLEVASYPDIYLNGVNLGEARWDTTEVTED